MLGVIGLPKPSALSIVHLNFKEVLRGWGQPCAVLGNTETQRTRRNPSSDFLFPISYFLFPISYSLFPIPHSPFPIPSVSLCLCVSKTTPFQSRASRQTGLTLARNPSIFVKLKGLQQPMPEGGICNPLRPIELLSRTSDHPGADWKCKHIFMPWRVRAQSDAMSV
jgi:hypothetical protein